MFQVTVMESHQENGKGGGCGPVRICGTPSKSRHLSELGSVYKMGMVMPTPSARPEDQVGRCTGLPHRGLTNVLPHCYPGSTQGWKEGGGGALCSLPLTLTI